MNLDPQILVRWGFSTTGHRIPNLVILSHVQIPAKKFDNMRAALDWVTKDLNALKSNKSKDPEEGYSQSHSYYSSSNQDIVRGHEEGAHPLMTVTQWGRMAKNRLEDRRVPIRCTIRFSGHYTLVGFKATLAEKFVEEVCSKLINE